MTLFSQSVPVKLADSWGGLASNHGILRIEESALILEFQTKDDLFDLIKSEPQRVRIPMVEIENCQFQAGWFSASIEIDVHRIEIFREVPGAQPGRLSLSVARRDRPRASALVDAANMALAREVVRAIEKPQP